MPASSLLHWQVSDAFGDAGYQGAQKRPDVKKDITWPVAMRPGKRKELARQTSPSMRLLIGSRRSRRASAPRLSTPSGCSNASLAIPTCATGGLMNAGERALRRRGAESQPCGLRAVGDRLDCVASTSAATGSTVCADRAADSCQCAGRQRCASPHRRPSIAAD